VDFDVLARAEHGALLRLARWLGLNLSSAERARANTRLLAMRIARAIKRGADSRRAVVRSRDVRV
jgi:ribosomal protein S3